MVLTKSAAADPGMSCAIRCLISCAALFVKVRHRMFDGGTPNSFTMYAYRYTRARVFPDPAPATTRMLPSVVITDSLWASLRVDRFISVPVFNYKGMSS